jgi:uncharacterized membrane protein
MFCSLIPFLFFITLFGVFLMGLAESRWASFLDYYSSLRWFLWVLLFPLSTLLVLQVAKVTKQPAIKLWAIFSLIPLAYVVSNTLSETAESFHQWLYVSSIVIGAISLLVIWSERQFLDQLSMRKNGKYRFINSELFMVKRNGVFDGFRNCAPYYWN